MKPESEHGIALGSADGSLVDGRILVYTHEDSIRVVLELESETYTEVATDAFDAFCNIRKELEKKQIQPHCLGATKNVYPSGMSRSMGNGIMAYRLTLGRQAMRDDLVNIFDGSNGSPIATVEEQDAFFEEWIASLGR